MTQALNGTWHSPLTPQLFNSTHGLYDVKWDTHSETLVWQERRSGGMALVSQAPNENPKDLLRDAVVGGRLLFGGGGFTVGHGMVYFVGEDARIYRLPLAGGLAVPITPPFGVAAAPALSPNGRWLLYVHRYEGQERLVVVPTDGTEYPRVLLQGVDFMMQPAWHPYGDRIACVTWNQPNMPWDASQLHLLYLASDAAPHVIARRVVAGVHGDEAIFGAAFSPDSGYLAYASDRNGWWQLYLYDLDLERSIPLTDDPAEYAVPAWLQGMRTFAWSPDSRALYALRTQESRFTLQRIDIISGFQETVQGLDAYTHLEQIAVNRLTGEIAVIGGSFTVPDRLLTLDAAETRVRVRAHTSTEAVPQDYLSVPQRVTWQVEGFAVEGFYYPPAHPQHRNETPPPMIVYPHSGPTRQRFARFFPEVHFFTSRGFAVLEPNYRGSTGYGRAFKDSLRGLWGVADVQDCAEGARLMVAQGLADARKLIIMGESSGGYTVLQSLIQVPDLYCAGIAQAPVGDHFAQLEMTHAFEQHYADVLLGALPEATARYHALSAVNRADEIGVPLAIFHGTADNVVPHAPSEQIAASLRRRGVPHVFRLYEGEGHSFRQPHNIADYYAQILAFLTRYVLYR